MTKARGLITLEVLGMAHIDVRAMDAAAKVRLADEIFAQQPNLLAAMLVLPRFGVTVVQLEVPLHVLFVTFRAMKRSGHRWPTITEDIQDKCLQRLIPLRVQ